MTLHVDEIRSDRALAELAPSWWDLWRRCPAATPFQSPAWALPWWRAFAPGQLCVITVRGDGRLLAVAPFYVETGQFGRRLLPIGIGVSDYHDILIEPGVADAVADTIVRHFAAMTWDFCEMPELLIGASAFRLTSPLGCHARTEPQSCAPILYLPPNAVDIRDIIPKPKLRKWRMAQHRAARRQGFSIRRVAACDAQDALDALVALHRARWNSRGEQGVLADPRVIAFHHDALPELFESKLARLYALSFEGRIAGLYYGFLQAKRAYAYLSGFNPHYQFESPGTLLTGYAICEAHREGVSEFHFLRGDEPYKFEWGAVAHWTYRRVFERARAYARAS